MNLSIANFQSTMVSAAAHVKNPWAISWLVSGFLAILIPVITWNINRGKYYNAYGYALEAEEEQRQYYENQQNNNNYNNYGYQNNNNNNNGDDDGNYSYYKDCSWINFACRTRQYFYATAEERQKAYEEGKLMQEVPGWYVILGGTENSEEMQRWKEEQTGVRAEDAMGNPAEGGLKFVYTVTLLLFIALVGYGAFNLGGVERKPRANLFALLIITAIVAFMNLIMTAQGVISSDDRDLENSYYGWYGQMGVLLAYTDFWFMLFSLAYLIAFRVSSYLEQREASQKEGAGADDEFLEDGAGGSATDYKAPSEVQMA